HTPVTVPGTEKEPARRRSHTSVTVPGTVTAFRTCPAGTGAATRLRGGGLRAASAAGGRGAREISGAVVAEISLLGAATRVGVVQAHRRAFSFCDFLATVVTHEDGLTSHLYSSRVEGVSGAKGSEIPAGIRRRS